MPARSWLRRVGVFVLVVILTIAVVTAASVAPALGPGPADDGRPEYDVARLVPDRPPSDGQIATERGDAAVVLIDQAHNNRVDRDDLQPFEAALTARGATVEYVQSPATFEQQLGRADAFVVLDPGVAYTAAEADRVASFVDSGGRLLLAGEPSQMGIQRAGLFAIIVPLPTRMAPLSSQFGIQFSEGYLFNMESHDGNYLNIFATGTEAPVADNVERTAMYTAAAVDTEDGDPILVATDGTRNARGDTPGEYVLAVQSGNVIAVGDRTFFEGGNFRVADNAQFLGNVIEFLTTGDRERTLRDYPGVVTNPPEIHYTASELLDAAQTIGGSLRAERASNPSVTLDNDATTRNADVLVTTFEHLGANPGIGTEIDVTGSSVSLPGYAGDTANLAVIHYTDDGTVVVAGETPDDAEAAASLLANRGFEPNMISDRTVIIRTPEV